MEVFSYEKTSIFLFYLLLFGIALPAFSMESVSDMPNKSSFPIVRHGVYCQDKEFEADGSPVFFKKLEIFQENQCVGCLTYTHMIQSDGSVVPNTWKILEISIFEGYRNQGFASILMFTFFKKMRAEGALAIHWISEPTEVSSTDKDFQQIRQALDQCYMHIINHHIVPHLQGVFTFNTENGCTKMSYLFSR